MSSLSLSALKIEFSILPKYGHKDIVVAISDFLSI